MKRIVEFSQFNLSDSEMIEIGNSKWTDKSKEEAYYTKIVKILNSCKTVEQLEKSFRLVIKYKLSFNTYPTSASKAIRVNKLVDILTLKLRSILYKDTI
jgi:hypothetical protein